MVGEATEVANKVVNSAQCFFSFATQVWYPGKMNTFILAVYEIEQIIEKLTVLRDKTVELSQFPTSAPVTPAPSLNIPGSNDLNTYQEIDNMITNWKSILSTYRSQTGDLTTAFTTEMQQYNGIVNSFAQFQSAQNTAAQTAFDALATMKSLSYIYDAVSAAVLFSKFLNPLTILDVVARTIQIIVYVGVRQSIKNYCSDDYVNNQQQFGSYTQSICLDFDFNRWTNFATFFSDACSMSIDFDGTNNEAAQVYGQVCKTGGAVDPNNFPGGIENSGVSQSLFQFLQSNKSYVTFGAGADTTLSWTSTVSSSLTHQSSLTLSNENKNNPYGKEKISSFVSEESTIGYEIGTKYKIDVSQASTRTEDFHKTVQIKLSDPNDGTELHNVVNHISTTLYFMSLYTFTCKQVTISSFE